MNQSLRIRILYIINDLFEKSFFVILINVITPFLSIGLCLFMIMNFVLSLMDILFMMSRFIMISISNLYILSVYILVDMAS